MEIQYWFSSYVWLLIAFGNLLECITPMKLINKSDSTYSYILLYSIHTHKCTVYKLVLHSPHRKGTRTRTRTYTRTLYCIQRDSEWSPVDCSTHYTVSSITWIYFKWSVSLSQLIFSFVWAAAECTTYFFVTMSRPFTSMLLIQWRRSKQHNQKIGIHKTIVCVRVLFCLDPYYMCSCSAPVRSELVNI